MNNLPTILIATQNDNGFPYPTHARKRLKRYAEYTEPVSLDDWKAMTLLTGIICKDGIVMAADAQQTRSDQKRRIANKISLIEFSNAHALVAESGVAAWSQRVIDLLERKAKTVEVTSSETISKFIEDAVREVSSDMRTALGTSRTTDEEWHDFVMNDERSFELLFAYYHDNQPYLFRVSLAVPIAQKAHTFFLAGGIGRELAEYLLMEFAGPEMESQFGTAIAVYVTEKVNESNLYCSGHSRLGILQLVPRNLFPMDEPLIVIPRMVAPEELMELSEIVRAVEHDTKAERDRVLTEQLRERTHKIMEELLNPRHPLEG